MISNLFSVYQEIQAKKVMKKIVMTFQIFVETFIFTKHIRGFAYITKLPIIMEINLVYRINTSFLVKFVELIK